MILSKRKIEKRRIDRLFDISGEKMTYKKWEMIYQKGSRINGVFRVLEGRVEIRIPDTTSVQNLILYFVHQKEIFGIIDFFYKKNCRRCEAIAIDKKVVIQSIPYPKIEKLLYRDADFRKEVMEHLIKAEEIIYRKYRELQINHVEERTLRVLYGIAKQNGVRTSKGIVLPTISHQDLSDYIGISRQSVTHVFVKLKRDGKIDYDRDQILLKTNTL